MCVYIYIHSLGLFLDVHFNYFRNCAAHKFFVKRKILPERNLSGNSCLIILALQFLLVLDQKKHFLRIFVI